MLYTIWDNVNDLLRGTFSFVNLSYIHIDYAPLLLYFMYNPYASVTYLI